MFTLETGDWGVGRMIATGGGFGRFGWLLTSMLLLLVLTPLLDLFSAGLPGSRVLSSVVLLAGVHALRRDPWMLRAGLGLAVAALICAWLTQQFDVPMLVFADYTLTFAFLGLTTGLVLASILNEAEVTLDTVMGGICIYLLLGVLWVSLYSALEYGVPGSFTLDGVALSELASTTDEDFRYPELLYFSFVTITTLGYGDVLPTNALARAMATGEAIVGQVYLAVFVASLVGLHLAQRTREPPRTL